MVLLVRGGLGSASGSGIVLCGLMSFSSDFLCVCVYGVVILGNDSVGVSFFGVCGVFF